MAMLSSSGNLLRPRQYWRQANRATSPGGDMVVFGWLSLSLRGLLLSFWMEGRE
jgi:hypothetical protein